MTMTKSALAVMLSKLHGFDSHKLKLEQYPTDSEIAATAIWTAYMNGDIRDKSIADLGSGTGILGIGALELGAKKAYFVEKDPAAVGILKRNLKGYRNYIIIQEEIAGFKQNVDTVIQNPPFGTKTRHADRDFLLKAFSLADAVYSFHKTATKAYISRVAEKNGYKVIESINFGFTLKHTQRYHKKPTQKVKVSLFHFKKQ